MENKPHSGNIPDQNCPKCGHHINKALDDASIHMPRAGDMGICVGCGCPLKFDAELKLRELTEEDMAQLDPRAVRMIARLKRERLVYLATHEVVNALKTYERSD